MGAFVTFFIFQISLMKRFFPLDFMISSLSHGSRSIKDNSSYLSSNDNEMFANMDKRRQYVFASTIVVTCYFI
jgi:hypothetical protein